MEGSRLQTARDATGPAILAVAPRVGCILERAVVRGNDRALRRFRTTKEAIVRENHPSSRHSPR